MKTSKFVNTVRKSDEYIIHNSLYPSVIKVTDSDLFEVVEEVCKKEGCYEALQFEDEKKQNFYEELVTQKFVIPDNTNEINIVNRAFRLYMEQVQNKRLWVFVFPTRNCNFRCPYCYEEHEEKIMSDETYEQTIAYILKLVRERDYKSILIAWFGGEPMLKYDKIVWFTEKLRRALPEGVNLGGQMTTNGYFLSVDKLARLSDLGIRSYQITVDGLAKTHNKTRILASGKGTWNEIIGNLMDAKASDIEFDITIRSNFSDEMMESADEWMKYLAQTFGNDKRFKYHFETVKDLGGDDTSFAYKGEENPMHRLVQIANEQGLPEKYTARFLQPFNLMCYAGNPNSIVIDTDGVLRKCTVCLDAEHNQVGKLEEELNENHYAWWTDYDLQEACKKCSVLPICYGKKCPSAYYSKFVCDGVKDCYFAALKAI